MDIKKLDAHLENILKGLADTSNQLMNLMPMAGHAMNNVGNAIFEVRKKVVDEYYQDLLDGNTELARTQHFLARMSSDFGDHVENFALTKLYLGENEHTVSNARTAGTNARLWALVEQERAHHLVSQDRRFKPDSIVIPIVEQVQQVRSATLFKIDLRVSHGTFNYSDYSYSNMVTGRLEYRPTKEEFEFPLEYVGVNYVADRLYFAITPQRYLVDFDLIDKALKANELNVFSYTVGEENNEAVVYHVLINLNWQSMPYHYEDNYVTNVKEQSCAVIRTVGGKVNNNHQTAISLNPDHTPMWVWVIIAMGLGHPYVSDHPTFTRFQRDNINRLDDYKVIEKAVYELQIGTAWERHGVPYCALADVVTQISTDPKVNDSVVYKVVFAKYVNNVWEWDEVNAESLTREGYLQHLRYGKFSGYRVTLSKNRFISQLPTEGTSLDDTPV